jgi:N-acetylmuramoyl-L-alanine amidase
MDIRTTQAEDGRIQFVEFVRRIEISGGAPAAAPTAPVAPAPVPAPAAVAAPAAPSTQPAVVENRPETPSAPPVLPRRLIGVIVLDPGHGGTDVGASNGELQEKELALAIAKRMRAAFESRLGSTVLLTRDSDISLTNEARSAIANNNQANLLVSVHIGQSPNMNDLGAVYVMKPPPAADPATRGRLFLPWSLGYRAAWPASDGAAKMLQDELSQALPPWKLPVRYGPIAVLASASMPSVVVEVGNLSNPVSAAMLVDPAFHNRVATAAAAAIERYAAVRQTGAN